METACSIPASELFHQDKPRNATALRREAHFPPRKVRLTVNLPTDLVEQMRDAVYWTPGLTLAWLIARAMRTSLAELRPRNQGPFPRRTKPLRAGRPRLTGQAMALEIGRGSGS